jgi:hypothetical protein
MAVTLLAASTRPKVPIRPRPSTMATALSWLVAALAVPTAAVG